MISHRAVRRTVLGALVFVLAWSIGAPATDAPQWHWEEVPRVIALGDTHGAYDRLTRMLEGLGIVDSEAAWSGGRTHLVSLGDVVDRGPDSRKVLDLLMRLEREADAAGGRVHLVLGNHEVMNLTGDLRYVSLSEYRAFAGDESAVDREQAWNRFRQHPPSEAPPDELRAEFDRRFPPGYFGLLDAFSPDGIYGRWLLERSVLVRVDGTAFVHGGLSDAVAGMSGEELNRESMGQLREYLALVDRFETLGLLAPEVGYADRVATLERATADPSLDIASLPGLGSEDELRKLVRRLAELTRDALVFVSDGPLWYRGTAQAEEATERPVLERALAVLGAERVAVGHTPTADGRIHVRIDGRALLIDTGMLEEVYRGRASALIQEGQKLSAYYADEQRTQTLAVASGVPKASEQPDEQPTDAELERFLLTAEVVKVEEIGSGVTRPLRVTLRQDGIERRAVFKSGDTFVGNVTDTRSLASINQTDRWTYDVAAYRVDRLIGLDMVPVAVVRPIRGMDGALQVWVEDAIDENERRTRTLEPQVQDKINRQLESMYVFDALIYNEDRHAGNVLFTTSDWKVHLIDHTRAFRTKTNRPETLRKVTLAPTPELAGAIAEMDDDALRQALDGLMHSMQVSSLLKRRKKLVGEWTDLGLLTGAEAGASR